MKSSTNIYELALCFVDQIGPTIARTLVDRLGSAEAVFKEKRSILKKLPSIGEERAKALCSRQAIERAEQEMKFIEKNNIEVLFFKDPDYPRRLLHCSDAPVLLFKKGDIDLNPTYSVAVVGTRNQSEHGAQTTLNLIRDWSKYNPTIISGLALGVDTTAHKTALKHNLPTIGVMGHSFDFVYPYANRKLFAEVQDKGALITEYPSGSKPDAQNFPKRNRLVAGMTDATIVIEAAIKGGALITGQIAASYNRDVFALPGRTTDVFSAGCLNLIKKNEATILTGAQDVIEGLGWTLDTKVEEPQQIALPIDLSTEEASIVSALGYGALEVDKLATATGKSVSQVFSLLTMLELQGVVRSLPGKRYALSSS